MKFVDHVSENDQNWGRRLSWNHNVILGSISTKDQWAFACAEVWRHQAGPSNLLFAEEYGRPVAGSRLSQ